MTSVQAQQKKLQTAAEEWNTEDVQESHDASTSLEWGLLTPPALTRSWPANQVWETGELCFSA